MNNGEQIVFITGNKRTLYPEYSPTRTFHYFILGVHNAEAKS